MSESLPQIYLARHGETPWSISGQHTGRSDIPLTDRGRRNAERLGKLLQPSVFQHVLSSPSSRARETCQLAGFGQQAQVDPDLAEWDYGNYEGLKTSEIRQQRPDWYLFRDGCPGGESVAQISDRADRVVARVRALAGDVLLFSSGHFLRVLGSRWLGLEAACGCMFLLSTATLSILGYEHTLGEPVFRLWNDDRHVGD